MLDTFSRERRARYGKTLELQRAYRGTVMLLSDVVEFDDEYTAEHSRSVVDLVHATADELNVDPGAREELEFAAMLHDVGKIAIPKEILNKPAKLTEEEFAVMKTHTIEGQFMLDQVGGLLARVGEIVRACHERWDGNGYPDGIAGEEIPLASRIVFACDAYNAMTSDRVYRKALARATAVEELRANAGTQFDPRVVAALIRVVELTRPELGLSTRGRHQGRAGRPPRQRQRAGRPLARAPLQQRRRCSRCRAGARRRRPRRPCRCRRRRSAARGSRPREIAAPAARKARANAQDAMESLMPNTRPVSSSLTVRWISSRS